MEHNLKCLLRPLIATALAYLLLTGAASAQTAQRSGADSSAARQHPAGQALQAGAGSDDRRISPLAPLKIDRSGRPRIGVASYYAGFFAGRKMADGARMDPRGINAASRTLPLGTVAKVTDLTTHRSAIVRIEDRGPYVRGRIVDLSPSTARRIGITRRSGIAKVRVTPLAVPSPGEPVRLASIAPARPTVSAELR